MGFLQLCDRFLLDCADLFGIFVSVSVDACKNGYGIRQKRLTSSRNYWFVLDGNCVVLSEEIWSMVFWVLVGWAGRCRPSTKRNIESNVTPAPRPVDGIHIHTQTVSNGMRSPDNWRSMKINGPFHGDGGGAQLMIGKYCLFLCAACWPDDTKSVMPNMRA